MVLHLKWVAALYLSISFGAVSADTVKPDIKFKKATIALAFKNYKKSISVELAESQEQHAQGLMFRKKLKNNEGMLFVFDDEQIREFWMKNTLIDLDIGYFDKNRKLIDIKQMQAVTSVMQIELPTYPSKRPAKYALEMIQGWFKKNKFEEGTVLNLSARP